MKTLRKRTRDDEGSMLVALMFVFLSIAIGAAFVASSARAVDTSSASKLVTATQQLRYTASQNAVSVLSSTNGATTSGRETVTLDGIRDASWEWEATSQTADGVITDCSGRTLYFPPTIDAKRVNATGTARTKDTASLERCFLVYGVNGEPDVNRNGTPGASDDVYTGTVNVSPNSVFGHALFGTAGVSFAGASVRGSVGASDDVSLDVEDSRFTGGGVFLYPSGPGVAPPVCTNSTRKNRDCKNVHTFEQRVQLDVVTVDDLASRTASSGGAGCADEATDPYAVDDSGRTIDPDSTIKAFETSWIASRHPGGLLDLGDGSQQCYKNLVFDAKTVVSGRLVSGTPTGNVFASGNVTFAPGADVNSADSGGVSSTKLAIYAVGNLDSRVEFGTGADSSRVSAFVYAPRAVCESGSGGNGTRSFLGSISCRVVAIGDERMTITGATVRPGDPFNYYTGYYPIWYPEQRSVNAS